MNLEYHIDASGKCSVRASDEESHSLLSIIKEKAPEVLEHMIKKQESEGFGGSIHLSKEEKRLEWMTFEKIHTEEKNHGA